METDVTGKALNLLTTPLTGYRVSIHRIYAFSPVPKDIWALPVTVFFDIFLTPKCSPQPVAIWGVAVQTEPKNIWERIIKVINVRGQPEFLSGEIEREWKSVPSMGFEAFEFRASPLIELQNPEVVERVVIQPLRDRLKTISRPPGASGPEA